jgi:hypothetical protein
MFVLDVKLVMGCRGKTIWDTTWSWYRKLWVKWFSRKIYQSPIFTRNKEISALSDKHPIFGKNTVKPRSLYPALPSRWNK